ncbi:MAG TPA: 1-acyl-sn-glycerol-3-phosphate acyltransferase, partial [Rhodobacter sp.]|nr:1-acyl-sn-glycerol-3-phosphate acyltransferase [Rhodobacter sp.]
SWMDIFVLNAAARSYFVAKSEVAGWPGIGLLARVTGTLFINRKKQHAKAQQAFFKKRLSLGHHLTFFPEGTSSDGVRILPFKSTLFEALLTDNIKNAAIQPISLRYQPAQGYDARLYGWWGDMGFAGHFWRILTTPQHGDVYVTYHAPLMARDFPNRKALAQACHAKVLAGFTAVPMS